MEERDYDPYEEYRTDDRDGCGTLIIMVFVLVLLGIAVIRML